MDDESKVAEEPLSSEIDPFEEDFNIRPGNISITIHRDENNVDLGVVFKSVEGQVRIVSLKTDGLLILNSPNVALQPLLHVGDVLEGINEFGLLDQPQEFCADILQNLNHASQTLVFVFRTESGSERRQSILVRPDGFTENGISLRRDRMDRLYISRLSMVWKHSLLRQSHLVRSINALPVLNITPDEAAQWLLLNEDPVISIESYPRRRTWRRAAVGIGGGTLVGVGSILMVTPLHPVGHAMALGGVGLLGTEFQGPKKVMEYTKKRFSWRRRRDDDSTTPQDPPAEQLPEES